MYKFYSLTLKKYGKVVDTSFREVGGVSVMVVFLNRGIISLSGAIISFEASYEFLLSFVGFGLLIPTIYGVIFILFLGITARVSRSRSPSAYLLACAILVGFMVSDLALLKFEIFSKLSQNQETAMAMMGTSMAYIISLLSHLIAFFGLHVHTYESGVPPVDMRKIFGETGLDQFQLPRTASQKEDAE